MRRMSMQERYLHDPLFRQLVDSLEAMAQRLQLTPTEIREAALLAQIHYEERQLRPPWQQGEEVLGGAISRTEQGAPHD